MLSRGHTHAVRRQATPGPGTAGSQNTPPCLSGLQVRRFRPVATDGHARTAQHCFSWECCTVPPTMMPMVPQRYGHGTADCTRRRSQHVKRAVMASVGGLKKALSRCYTRLAEGSWRLCHGGGFGSDRKRLPNFASVSRRALAWGRAITRRDRQSTREPIRFDRSYGERYLYWRRRKITLAGASLAHAISAINRRFAKCRSEDRCETCR